MFGVASTSVTLACFFVALLQTIPDGSDYADFYVSDYKEYGHSMPSATATVAAAAAPLGCRASPALSGANNDGFVLLALVGAAREPKDGGKTFTSRSWENMMTQTGSHIVNLVGCRAPEEIDWTRIVLISGGSAWADHRALLLVVFQYARNTFYVYIMYAIHGRNLISLVSISTVAVALKLLHPECHLTLHLPAKWDSVSKRFVDDKTHWTTNPGGLLNWVHKNFTEFMQRSYPNFNSFEDLNRVLSQATGLVGAGVTTTGNCYPVTGMHPRNIKVAQSRSHMLAFSFGEGDRPTDGGTKYTWDRFQPVALPPGPYAHGNDRDERYTQRHHYTIS